LGVAVHPGVVAQPTTVEELTGVFEAGRLGEVDLPALISGTRRSDNPYGASTNE
jgi:hypothetical protein